MQVVETHTATLGGVLPTRNHYWAFFIIGFWRMRNGMARAFDRLEQFFDHDFDTVIDVRSPAEYAEDHIPGAINLPALDNEQRAEVGTIYKQVSPFKARKIGAAMVIRNVASHIEGPLAAKDGGWQPLVYCWRGGQRSGVFGTLLSEIGWRAETVKGGYTTYRRLVNDALYEKPLKHRLILLDGDTGTAKTALLARLQDHGVQTIDLEGLAQHRGSLLGEMPQGQPSQKGFETKLAMALHHCDPDRPVVVEAESSKIGKISLPKSLWAAMCEAPRMTVKAPAMARALFLAETYRDIIADPERLAGKLAPLRRLHGHAKVDGWIALSQEGDLVGLSHALMVDHYDPAYARSRRRIAEDHLATFTAEALDGAALDVLAQQIAQVVNQQ